MNECFFCGPTERPLTEEHVWPKWVSKLLRGKYGSDHFVHIRSTGSSTEGCWKSPHLQITTDTLCDTCNNVWLSNFENQVIKPLVSPLALGESTPIKPADQWQIAAWAYKMAMLLEIAMPAEERHQEFYTPSERKQFRHETIPDEHVRVFLANYKYGQEPAHAHQHLHTLRRRDDGFPCHLKICTITAGCLGMQVIAARSINTGRLVYASSEVEMELLGKAKQAIMPIWPPTNEGLRWPPPEAMTQQDIEDWTDMWSKAEGMYPPDSGQRENRP